MTPVLIHGVGSPILRTVPHQGGPVTVPSEGCVTDLECVGKSTGRGGEETGTGRVTGRVDGE